MSDQPGQHQRPLSDQERANQQAAAALQLQTAGRARHEPIAWSNPPAPTAAQPLRASQRQPAPPRQERQRQHPVLPPVQRQLSGSVQKSGASHRQRLRRKQHSGSTHTELEAGEERASSGAAGSSQFPSGYRTEPSQYREQPRPPPAARPPSPEPEGPELPPPIQRQLITAFTDLHIADSAEQRLQIYNPYNPDPEDSVALLAYRQRLLDNLSTLEKEQVYALFHPKPLLHWGEKADVVFGLLEQRGILLYCCSEYRRLLEHSLSPGCFRMDLPSTTSLTQEIRPPIDLFAQMDANWEAARYSKYVVPQGIHNSILEDTQRVLNRFQPAPDSTVPPLHGEQCARCGKITHSVAYCPAVWYPEV